jgi:signal peptidase I
MEIETAPRHPAPTPWGRLLLSVIVLAPVSLLVLLPIGLGLDRYVMTGDSMAGGIDRGSIAFERVVPVSSLRVGDVITYPRPGASDESTRVTHRIIAIEPDGIRTQGDARRAPDPWTLHPQGSTMSRVEFTVPWVGWAYLFLFGPKGWALTIASALALLLMMGNRRRRRSSTARTPTASTPAPIAVASGRAAPDPSASPRRGSPNHD